MGTYYNIILYIIYSLCRVYKSIDRPAYKIARQRVVHSEFFSTGCKDATCTSHITGLNVLFLIITLAKKKCVSIIITRTVETLDVLLCCEFCDEWWWSSYGQYDYTLQYINVWNIKTYKVDIHTIHYNAVSIFIQFFFFLYFYLIFNKKKYHYFSLHSESNMYNLYLNLTNLNISLFIFSNSLSVHAIYKITDSQKTFFSFWDKTLIIFCILY